jgi:uncharacterized hydrophobic protein (TIGR00271 family)
VRQLTIVIPPQDAERVRAAAAGNSIEVMAEVEAVRDGAQRVLMLCDAPNAAIEGFLAALEEVEGLYVTYAPQGVLALRPPANQPEDEVTDVQPRSPLEIFLSGLQSIGSWTGFISYAALGGVIVWVALFTESVFLLVAAMLIAPFAGPAMNTALATARGDLYLLKRSLLRYVAALATAIAVAALLSLIFDQKIATGLMISSSMRSAVSVLLPLAAGAAGALNLAQSERSSLVSGAATGMLVAAALAPPAGLVGMGLVIGQMDIVYSSLWALAIQIVGINLAGFVVFRLYGVTNKGPRYPRGKSAITVGALALSMASVLALLVVQFSFSPQFEQSSLAQRITALAQQQIETRDDVELIMAQAAFSRARPPGENPVLLTIQVEGDLTEAQQSRLAASLRAMIEREFGVRALVDLTAL